VKTLAVALLLCAILALPVTLCAREPQRIGLAGKLAAGPEIDGRLDERCWKELRALDRFTCVITKTGPADAATRAYVGYDKKNLYVAFQCDEPKMELLKTYASKGALNPFDESVEIFIDSNHDRNTYYQLRVDVLGRRQVRYGMEIVGDFFWEAKVSLSDDGWVVETVIPFSSLKTKVATEALWGFNVNRQRLMIPPTEYSAWSNTAGGFHAPGKFGLLVLGNYRDSFNTYFKRRSRPMRRKLEQLYRTYPSSTASRKKLMEDFQRISGRFQKKLAASKPEKERDALALFKELESRTEALEDILSRLRLAVIKGEFK